MIEKNDSGHTFPRARAITTRARSLALLTSRLVIAIGALVALGGCGAGTPANNRGASASNGSEAGGGARSRGALLYTADGCSSCHSLDGSRKTGPTWKGLAGSTVTLSDGRTIIATNAYLRRHIVKPNAMTVRGYPGAIMAQAIESLHLEKKPTDVAALVHFIDSLR